MTPEEKKQRTREYNKKYHADRKKLLQENPNHVFGNPGRPRNTPDEIWRKVDKRGPDECWPWLWFKNENGYGRTEINGKMYYAHRIVFDLINPGIIALSAPKSTDENGFILHSCDNPSCCNPAHLRVGTHAENMADKVRRGRSAKFKGDKGPRCKITMEQAKEARRRHFEDGISRKELMLELGISRPSIDSLINGKTYKEG